MAVALAIHLSPFNKTKLKKMHLSVCRHNVVAPIRLLFCHGLRADMGEAEFFKRWTERQTEGGEFSMQFQKLCYTKENSNGRKYWLVDDWANDIANELMNSPPLVEKTLIVSISAGSHALLRAITQHPGIEKKISALLLISPAFGVKFADYMNKVLFAQADALNRGELILHPGMDESEQVIIGLESIKEYIENCPLHSTLPLPQLNFPVRIVHGCADKLIPFENILALFKRIKAKDKSLLLVQSGHIIKDFNKLDDVMHTLWTVVKNKDGSE